MVLVAGSLNMDLVIRCATIPLPGQTLPGSDFVTVPGGKGANQAAGALACTVVGAQTSIPSRAACVKLMKTGKRAVTK